LRPIEVTTVRLILLRHGETLWNAEQRLQGHDNSALSERGIEQAQRFAPIAKILRPSQVVSSDLGRARQTAELIGYGKCPSDERLRERNLGEWSGRSKSEILEGEDRERYLAWQAGNYIPPGAESWDAFRRRVAGGLRSWLSTSPGDLLCVVHNGVIRAACHEFLDLPPSRSLPVTPGTATILRFDENNSRPARLEAYNLGAFLPDARVAD
jgi:broad specificity phosphatase PhoE